MFYRFWLTIFCATLRFAQLKCWEHDSSGQSLVTGLCWNLRGCIRDVWERERESQSVCVCE